MAIEQSAAEIPKIKFTFTQINWIQQITNSKKKMFVEKLVEIEFQTELTQINGIITANCIGNQ